MRTSRSVIFLGSTRTRSTSADPPNQAKKTVETGMQWPPGPCSVNLRRSVMRPARKDVPKIRRAADKPNRNSYVAPKLEPETPLDPRLAAPVWHVWVEGGDPIGPVSADQIARGVRAGRVPSDASVRHDSDVFWSDLLDQRDILDAIKAVTAESEAPPSVNLTAPRLLVWVDDGDAVGPVSAMQLARGLRAGKVPSHASVQRTDDFFATDLIDEPDVIAALKLV